MSELSIRQGQIIADRFRIEAELGRGGMGAVFLATQLNLDRLIALKMLLPQLARDKSARARFEREAKVASTLRHPNAVEIFDFGHDGDHLFLAMAYLRGQTLRDLLDASPFPQKVDRVLTVGAQMADVLAAAHRVPLIHRDIKPDNIFLEQTDDGEDKAVVVDFGLAFIAEHDSLGRLTEAGKVFGSPAYMSPEQVRQGVAITPACDIYSLGCVLHELVTNEPPFPGNGIQVLTKHVFAAPEPLSQRFPHLTLPATLESLILRMLRKRADERPSGIEVRETLRAIQRGDVDQRKSSATGLIGRAARMVERPGTPIKGSMIIQETQDLRVQGFSVVHIGELPTELREGLVTNGFNVNRLEGNLIKGEHKVLIGLDLSLVQIAVFTGKGVPVIADTDASDLDRVQELIRLGVSEVVMRPVAPDDLVRKVRRAHKKAKRKAK